MEFYSITAIHLRPSFQLDTSMYIDILYRGLSIGRVYIRDHLGSKLPIYKSEGGPLADGMIFSERPLVRKSDTQIPLMWTYQLHEGPEWKPWDSYTELL